MENTTTSVDVSGNTDWNEWCSEPCELLENRVSTCLQGGIEIFGTDEQRKTMFESWAKYFMEVQNPVNDKLNTFFKAKYAPMDIVLEAIRPVMGKYGLSLVQTPFTDGEMIGMQSVVIHKDGGMMSFPVLRGKATKPDIQGIGSVISYMRRYTATAIAGIIGSEEDDDGNGASEIPTSKSHPKNEALSKAKNECVATIANKIKDVGRKQVMAELKKFEPTEGNINLITNVAKITEINQAISLLTKGAD
ncbi:MAG: ERF family protein [Oscillospiraceae bacterium]